jgi:hypothetical protein
LACAEYVVAVAAIGGMSLITIGSWLRGESGEK